MFMTLVVFECNLCVSESVIDWLIDWLSEFVMPQCAWQPLLSCSMFSVRCVLRLEKQLSIEHMLQHGAARWQHCSRWNEHWFGVLSIKEHGCLSYYRQVADVFVCSLYISEPASVHWMSSCSFLGYTSTNEQSFISIDLPLTVMWTGFPDNADACPSCGRGALEARDPHNRG